MRFVRFSLFYAIAAGLLLVFGVNHEAAASNRQQDDQPCIFLSGALPIPDDSSWLNICLIDPSAPDETTVAEMNLKIVVDHPDPKQLEIQLTRTDSDIKLPLPSTLITNEGIGSFPQIHDFDGSSSQGEWIVQIRDTAGPCSGHIVRSDGLGQ